MAVPTRHAVAADANTCGYIPFPMTTLMFPQNAIPYACVNPETDCISSGSYMGCGSPIPTTCVETAKAVRRCEPGQLCCGPQPHTACWTWHSIDDAATYTLLQCSSASGVGTLISDSVMPAGTLTVTTKDESPRTSDDAKTTGTAKVYTTTAGVSVTTKTRLLVPDLPSETSNAAGEASPGAITGSIVGALAFLGILMGGTLFIWNRSRKKKRLAHEAAIGGPVTPVKKRDSILEVPYHAGAINVPMPSIYGGRSERIPRAESDVQEIPTKPPRRPARSPARKMNVTEGGWI
ncbi:hypothetical protein CORC01_10344 [Colletotrichum orchidophilum]|uniref:Uncharacterized protein n=1 Tax=Colletotrichum orchidophilum TaxID=1209926 RepID=A0A1G4AZ67_9PEZI|nr:uncharacterized protein CORC01_10344 [Colletotrichum orchidophilum]OHE94416.1 hypothetical protein CORC01_10344 [Colletotrichum orchidophilum]